MAGSRRSKRWSTTTAPASRTIPTPTAGCGTVNLNAQQKANLVAFLKTLTDESFLTDPRFSNPFQIQTASR